MIIATRPRVRWPVEHVPQDMSMMGLVLATAELNGHGDVGNILRFAGISTWNGIGLAMRDPAARRIMAHVLDQPQEVVDVRSHMLAASLHGMDAVDFFGARVPAFDLLYDRRRVGPTDDRRAFHHRALWQLIQIPVDHETGSRVVDHCASCGTKLGWRHLDQAWRCADYMNGRRDRAGEIEPVYDCRAAGAGCNDVHATIVGEDAAGVVALAHLLDPRPELHVAARDALHPQLRDLDRGIVFYLGLKLGRAVALEGAATRLRRAAEPPFDEAVAAMRAGAAIIREWPDGLARMIRGKADDDHERAMAAISAVRRVSHGETAWPEHREAIAAAMPDVAEGHYQRVVRRLTDGLVDGQTAARTIGIRTPNLVFLVRPGILKPVVARGTAKIHGSFRETDVQDIAGVLADSMDATTAVDALGITLHGIEQLCLTPVARPSGGTLLEVADHPAVRALHSRLRITRTGFDRLVADIATKASPTAGEGGRMSLRHAVLAIGGREKPWGAILAALLDGRLRFHLAKPPGRFVDRIMVAPGEALDAALAATFDRANHPDFAFSPTMRQRDAIELMNIDPSRWQQIHRLLPPAAAGSAKSLVVDPILEVARRIVDQREARARWDVRLDRGAMIDGGLGWSRDDVEAVADAMASARAQRLMTSTPNA